MGGAHTVCSASARTRTARRALGRLTRLDLALEVTSCAYFGDATTEVVAMYAMFVGVEFVFCWQSEPQAGKHYRITYRIFALPESRAVSGSVGFLTLGSGYFGCSCSFSYSFSADGRSSASHCLFSERRVLVFGQAVVNRCDGGRYTSQGEG
eukprot:1182437-Prorocentrum_minimum.AAC.1